MQKFLPCMAAIVLLYSCIPLRIAPAIADYKVSSGKKFKRGLPQRHMFIFEDPKPANEFYDYINTKFHLEDDKVYDDVPFTISDRLYFFSFYEVEIQDKTLNLAPMLLDAAWNEMMFDGDEESRGIEPEDMIRKGNWYIAIEVYNDMEKDCLAPNALSREQVLKYLSALKKEYLALHNYNEIVFKN